MNNKTVVVIGGGLGGLSAAITLRQAGFNVSLYEKNRHFGGKLNRLTQDGFGFDLGPSILTMPYIFENLFKSSHKRMEDYVDIIELPLQWRCFFPSGHIYDLYKDLEAMQENNEHLTAKDINEYRNFLAYAGRIHELTKDSYFDQGIDTKLKLIKHHGPIKAIKGFDYFSTMQQAINRYISNEEFRDIIGYFIKYVGSSSYDAPAVLNMMSHMQYQQGEWYVPGGMHLLGEAIVKLAEEIGVKLHLDSEIVKLEIEGKRIVAMELVDGKRITADYFVSNMEVIPLYEKLVNPPKNLASLKKKFEPASSGLVLHIGVNKEYPQLQHHNFFFSNNSKKNFERVFNEKKLPIDPTIYVVNTNKTDKAQAPVGHENIKILPHIPYIQDKPFTKKQYQELRENVLVKLENMGLEDLRRHIVTEDMWTPHDIEDMYLSDRGAIYGTLSNRKSNNGFKHRKHSEHFDNLYFVGGTVNPGGGMPMVTLSGQQVGRMIKEQEQ
ncbi:phytoene desaturase family protein [Staphylococcus chromogenes]|uniref:phytoene desaturase family protein n=1 Tax=Staphylococcus chromogenes TaxID=46126 RepID=UPI00290228E4|nr:phytoene desaturase family protein [Staphylococcus chromogenes]MDU0451605.1 phytoene desaturase family protein [Staphylococcus chromogenes]